MIRFLCGLSCFIGILLLGAAFIFIVYDGTRSIADDRFIYSKVTEVWTMLDAAGRQQFQLFIKKDAGQWLEPMLEAPAFMAFGLCGAILVLLGADNSRSATLHLSSSHEI